SFIVGYYLFFIKAIPALGDQIVYAPRYLLPVIPFAAIFAGYGLFWFLKNAKFIPKIIRVILLVAILSFTLYLPLKWDYVLIQPNTRLLAQDWVYKNIPQGARIINFDAYSFLNENRKTMEDTQKYNQEFFLTKQKYLLSVEDSEFPKPNYYVFIPYHYAEYYEEIPEEIRNKGFDYAVIGWWNKEDYLNSESLAQKFGVSVGIEEKNLIKRFPESATMESSVGDIVNNMREPFHYLRIMENTGPIIDIYKLPKS
ncbi:MAG: hypothetical protein Q8N69_02820, partial [bacterium]|nr:hypothetical protein [bacterium]